MMRYLIAGIVVFSGYVANTFQVQTSPPPAEQDVWGVALGCLSPEPPKAKAFREWIELSYATVSELNKKEGRYEAEEIEACIKKASGKFPKSAHWHPLDGALSKRLTIRLQGSGALAFFVIKVGLLCVHKSYGEKHQNDELGLKPLIKSALKDADGKKFCAAISNINTNRVASCFLRCANPETQNKEDIDELLLGAIHALSRTTVDVCKSVIEESSMVKLWGDGVRPKQTSSGRTSGGSLWNRKSEQTEDDVLKQNIVLKQGLKDPRKRLRGGLERIRETLGTNVQNQTMIPKSSVGNNPD